MNAKIFLQAFVAIVGTTCFLSGAWILLTVFEHPVGQQVGLLTVIPSSEVSGVVCPVGDAPKVDFTITAPRNLAIRLVDVKTGCGCAAGKLSKKVLNNGGEAVVSLQKSAGGALDGEAFAISAVLSYTCEGDETLRFVNLLARGRFVKYP